MIHHTLEFKGTNLHYQDEGNGDIVLVLIHGFMTDLRVWSSYVFSYMRDIRVVTIDLLGHGHSGWIEDTPSTTDLQAEAVKEVLDYLGINECVMVGHSMGGYVSLAFAEAYPEIPLYIGALDRELNQNAYICPGLGDCGDRIYGTVDE